MHPLETELQVRWNEIFLALATGDDVPPATRLRAEGMMEAAVLLGAASRDALIESMDECYRNAGGQRIAEDFGADWQSLFPFPQIPAMMQRAPVFPSTKD